mgnify:CR=1 FL=1
MISAWYIDYLQLICNFSINTNYFCSIQIFDIQGSLIAVLDEQHLEPEKYKAIWRPDARVSAGVYFAILKLNDLQVHYLKIVKL